MKMNDAGMKAIIKKFFYRRSIPNWMLSIFIIVLIVFVASGWKIVYNPTLKNDWGAIDAVGGWTSAVISGVAIWFAVSAPKRIAQRQNAIALFDLRFSSYIIYLKYISFAEAIREIDTPNQLNQAFSLYFMEYGSMLDLKELVMNIRSDERKLMSGLFLFSNFCDGKTIQGIVLDMFEVIELTQHKGLEFLEEDKAKVTSFCDKCKSFGDKYMEEMRRQMVLSNP